MDLLPLIQPYLVKILRSDPFIQAVVLTDRTGLTLLSLAKNENVGSYATGIAALASALFSGSAAQGQDIMGGLDLILSEFTSGKIFLKGCGTTVIVVVTSFRASYVHIRRSLKRNAGLIESFLEKISTIAEKKPETENLAQALTLLDF